MALNRIELMGRFTKNPELRRTPSGVAVTTFCLAVERDFKDKQTGKRECDFINCVAYKNTAEHIQQYFTKGSMAVVDGRLQIRVWQADDGKNRYITEVIISNIYFGEGKKYSQSNFGSTGGYSGQEWNEMDDSESGTLPF